MGIVSGGGGGSGLPHQWVVTPSTGGRVVTLTGAEGDNDYGAVDQIINSSGHTIYSADSAGDFNFSALNADIGIVTVNVDPSVGTLLPRSSVLSLYNDSTSGLGWWFTGSGHEAHGTRAIPVDANVHANEAWDWFDSTNGAAKFGRKGKTADGTVVQTVSPMAPPITSGALPTVALVSGTGAQVALNRNAETVTPFTGDATNNAATCKIELSPDNVTYSTLNTMSIAAALNLSGALDLNVNVQVPAGWYLKLTATHGSLGTTTYY